MMGRSAQFVRNIKEQRQANPLDDTIGLVNLTEISPKLIICAVPNPAAVEVRLSVCLICLSVSLSRLSVCLQCSSVDHPQPIPDALCAHAESDFAWHCDCDHGREHLPRGLQV